MGRELARTAAARRIEFTALAHAELDIADPAAVARALALHRPTLIINAAAYTQVDRAESEQAAARRSNEQGPAVLAKTCDAAAVPLIHVSTDYVFDGNKIDPYVEGDPIQPLSVYGKTKAAGEAAVRRATKRHVIVRTSWVYGEFGNNFLKTMVRFAQERDELRVVADQRGCPTSTRSLADALLRIAPRLIAGDALWGTYHFAGAGVTTWYGFAQRIIAAQAPLTGRRPTVHPIGTADYPTAARRPANAALDSSLFSRTFDVAPRPWGEETDAVTCEVVKAGRRKQQNVA